MDVKVSHIAIISDKGGRSANQDYAVAFESKFGILMVLCDGMGGAKGGEVASKLIAEYIISEYKKFNDKISIKEFLIYTLQNANKALLEAANASSELSEMKTTLALVHVQENRAIFIHVGDSRIYLFRKGNLTFRSKDHSKVQELIDRGKLKEKMAMGHPKSNIITRAMGAGDNCLMEIKNVSISKSDLIFLTSDGIHGSLTDFQIKKAVLFSKSVGDIVDRLSDLAKKFGLEKLNNRHDNLTIIAYSKKFVNFGRIYLYIITLFLSTIFLLNIFLLKGNGNSTSGVGPKVDTVFIDKPISILEHNKINLMDKHTLYLININKVDSVKDSMFSNMGFKLHKLDSINYQIKCK